MNTAPQRLFRIGPYRVDLDLNRVARNGDHVSLPPKAAAVLGALIRAQGRVVQRERLLESVWPDTIPTDDVLTQAIRELRLAFGDSATDSHTIETIPKVGYRLTRPATTVTEKTPRRVLSVLGVVIGLAVITSWIVWAPDNPNATQHGSAAPELDVRPFVTEAGRDISPRFSRDGQSLAYVHESEDGADLFVRPIDGGEARRLTNTADEIEHSPAWSPDGDRIAYNVRRQGERCEIRIMDLASGNSEAVAGDCYTGGVTFVDWSPDGEWIAYSSYEADINVDAEALMHTIRLVSPDGLRTRRVSFAPDATYSDIRPSFSPDSQKIAFVRARSDALRELIVLDLNTGEERRVNPDDLWVITARWTREPDTFVTAAHKSTLFRTFTLNAVTGAVSELNIRGANDLDVDPVHQRIAYTTSEIDTNLWRYDPAAAEFAPVDAANSTVSEGRPVFTADGTLMFVSMRSGMWEIWQVPPSGDAAERVTFSEHAGVGTPSLSPDGEKLLYIRHDTDGGTLYWQDMRTGEAAPVPELEELRVSQAAWSPDGCCVVYVAEVYGYWQLWRRNLDGGPPEQWLARNVDVFSFAPDGSVVLKLEGESGLHRFDPRLKSLVAIPGTTLAFSSTFAPTPTGLYFLERGDPGTDVQLVYLSHDGARDVIAGIPRASGGGLAVDPRDGSVYFVRLDKREADIYLARMAALEGPQPRP